MKGGWSFGVHTRSGREDVHHSSLAHWTSRSFWFSCWISWQFGTMCNPTFCCLLAVCRSVKPCQTTSNHCKHLQTICEYLWSLYITLFIPVLTRFRKISQVNMFSYICFHCVPTFEIKADVQHIQNALTQTGVYTEADTGCMCLNLN